MEKKPGYLRCFFAFIFMILAWIPVSSNAVVDKDGDGRLDNQDNCIEIENSNQHDSNSDGYGNACDADLNNDGNVNFADLNLFRIAFTTKKSDSDADFNSDGIVNISDFYVFKDLYGKPPGPAGSSEEPVDNLDPPNNNDNSISLPLLPAGNHIGIADGFNRKNSPRTINKIAATRKEAISKGMAVDNIQLDWERLEPKPYQYNKQLLEDALISNQASGLNTLVVISTIDSEGFTLPEDLLDASSGTGFAYGVAFDDPVIVKRFKKLLDWVVPMIVKHGGWGLSVGNEPGDYITDTPSTEQSVVNFLAAARDHAHLIDSNLAITMSLSQELLERGETFHFRILENCDFANFNYYGVTSDYFADDPAKVDQEIDQMLHAVGNKPLYLQELGAPSGYKNGSPMNASPTKQKQFLESVFAKMRIEPQFRGATIFQSVDLEAEIVDEFHTGGLFGEEGVTRAFVNRVGETFGSTGLLYSNGNEKPAKKAVIDAIFAL
jgi:hypothetical protein